MLTLGLNAGYDDASACLIDDGCIVGAARENYFHHAGHGLRIMPFTVSALPFWAIAWCLKKHKIKLTDIDHVAYAWDPAQFDNHRLPPGFLAMPASPGAALGNLYHLWEQLFLGQISTASACLSAAYPEHLADLFAGSARFSWHYVAHMTAHMASAYLTSPWDDAAIVCLNARSEHAGTTYALGQGLAIDPIGQVPMPHSLSLLCEEITAHLGFRAGFDETKVMALAAHGRPRFRQAFAKLVVIHAEGQYRIFHEDIVGLLGPKRSAGEPIEARHKDIACSLQETLNETVLQLAHWLKERTQSPHLALAGDMTHNCVLNSALRDAGLFDDVWIQPVVNDSAASLGAALLTDNAMRAPRTRNRPAHTDLGPQFTAEDIEEALVRSGLPFGRPPAIVVAVAARLASGKIVAWFQGGMEFGPYGLGNRSILASPTDPLMTERLNQIKGRELFQPIASAVLAEAAGDWFEDTKPSPFLSFISRIRKDRAPRIPAAVHVDGTVRVQTVDRSVQPLFYDVIEAFGALTAIPVLLNTAFCTHGRPLVCTPTDAIERYASTSIDALALGPFLLEKVR
ncbi:MAG: carbamoyltransferase family protein [Acidiferrobacter sp.]